MLLLCYLKFSKGLDFRAACQRNPLKYHQWSHFIQRMIKLPSPKWETSLYYTDVSLSSSAPLISLFYTHVRTMAACEAEVGQKFKKEFSPTSRVCFLFFLQLHINPKDLRNILGEVNPVTLRWHFAPPTATPSPRSPKLTGRLICQWKVPLCTSFITCYWKRAQKIGLLWKVNHSPREKIRALAT